jgi:hypothetical protein
MASNANRLLMGRVFVLTRCRVKLSGADADIAHRASHNDRCRSGRAGVESSGHSQPVLAGYDQSVVTIEQMGDVSPGYTANRAVNAVPFVCAAPPGIRTTADLPQIIARLG